MKKVISAQALMGNGKTVFSGLFDENGDPVEIELENEDGCTLMTIVCDTEDDDDLEDDNYEDECVCESCRGKRDGEILTEDVIQRVCRTQVCCNGCPLHDNCNPEGADI